MTKWCGGLLEPISLLVMGSGRAIFGTHVEWRLKTKTLPEGGRELFLFMLRIWGEPFLVHMWSGNYKLKHYQRAEGNVGRPIARQITTVILGGQITTVILGGPAT